MKKLLALIVTVLLLATVMAVPAMANGQNEVYVSSVDELMAALASDTKIILAPGEYLCVSETVQEFWEDEVWEYQLPKPVDILGLSNVTIEGNGQAEIMLDVGFEAVIRVMDSENIVLSGLILGHDVPEYGCGGSGYVISLGNSNNVTIQNCDLYGCGVCGIDMWSGGNVMVNNTVIRDCMANAANFYNLNGPVTFNDCTFSANAYDQSTASWTAFFEVSMGETAGKDAKLVLNNCVIKDNKNTMFINGEPGKTKIELNNCAFSNNVWENEVHVKHNMHNYWSQVYFEDQKPILKDGRTLVPIRGILENLGYTVDWDGNTNTAIISKADVDYEVRVTIDSTTIYKGDEAIEIDVPACIINDRTMVPLRAISEAFDMKVDWDDVARCVLLYALAD